jgi:hypothetical protein
MRTSIGFGDRAAATVEAKARRATMKVNIHFCGGDKISA